MPILLQSMQSKIHMSNFIQKRGIFVVHCICHRLALILSDAIKGTKAQAKAIPHRCINLLTALHTALHNNFSKSAKRKIKLRNHLKDYNQRRAELQGRNILVAVPVASRRSRRRLERCTAYLGSSAWIAEKNLLTRWLSYVEAVKVVLVPTCSTAYAEFCCIRGREFGCNLATQNKELVAATEIRDDCFTR